MLGCEQVIGVIDGFGEMDAVITVGHGKSDATMLPVEQARRSRGS